MQSFESILEQAVARKGSIAAVEKKLPKIKSARTLSKVSDAEFLSLMSRRIFRAGLKHSMVDGKWHDFERVFNEFEINQVRMMSEEHLDTLMKDKSIIRHWGKIKSVRSNAQTIHELSESYDNFSNYLNEWASTDIVGLWEDLKQRFTQLGGNSGPYFLRMAGKDTFLLTQHVITALNKWGAYQGDPKSKKARKVVQEKFNSWMDESKRPLAHISVILAMSID